MKKVYTAPLLNVYGSVADITQTGNKKLGFSDTFVVIPVIDVVVPLPIKDKPSPSTGS